MECVNAEGDLGANVAGPLLPGQQRNDISTTA